ncbi:Holliday junction branch migration protein RuvA [Pedococcus bigeumensis]|uniref:Holliday junction branch migration complex subunit RuvA n=1 Tax=Pedococcus bigeumensis TaxID=433644 RepID=A0A502CZH5_9MICO|nr:Holliday junction branch migration protein RuvA [Pedococcus bigeumensis]TPG18074.1 Holliday junction branch migration protein RuvA [Pedococcus bigeumensis]
MIASVRGPVRHLGLDRVVIEVGGVGMLLHTTPATASALHLGQEALLATTLVVREDSLTLYAFTTDDERDIFEQVQTVSGVGPRIALAMLSVLAPDRLRAAVTSADLATLTKVPGIGKKGAERIVLELRDKLGMPFGAAGATTAVPPVGATAWRDQVAEALVGLGYSAKQADDAVSKAADAAPAGADVSAMLRAALRELGR